MTPDPLRGARAAAYRHDARENSDRRERARQVTALVREGYSTSEIARRVGLSDRQVDRLRSRSLSLPTFGLVDPTTVSDERADELEKLAALVVRMVGSLHDEDPRIVWQCVTQLTGRQLREALVVAMALIPDVVPFSVLSEWVVEIGQRCDG